MNRQMRHALMNILAATAVLINQITQAEAIDMTEGWEAAFLKFGPHEKNEVIEREKTDAAPDGRIGTDAIVRTIEPRQQFIQTGIMFAESTTGYITFEITFRDLQLRVENARQLMRASDQPIREILSQDDFVATATALDELVNFFSTKEDDTFSHEQRNDARIIVRQRRDVGHSDAFKQAVQKFAEAAKKENEEKQAEATDNAPRTTANAPRTTANPPRTTANPPRSTLMSEANAREGAPQERGIGTAITTMLGLYNAVKGVATDKIAEANTRALRKIIQEVEAVRTFAEEMQEQANTQEEEMLLLKRLHKKQEFMKYWAHTKTLINAATKIAVTATEQRLDPAIEKMIDIARIWRIFARKVRQDNWRPAIDQAQYLFQLPASFAGSRDNIRVQVHIPMRQEKAIPWKIVKYIGRPMWHREKLLTLYPETTQIAIDDETRSYMEMKEDELSVCEEIRGQWFCPATVRVTHTDHYESCIAAIWASDWTATKETCRMQVRPPRLMAWAEGPNEFIVIAPNKTEGIRECPHKPPQAMIVQGYQEVWLRSGCKFTTHNFQLAAGNDTVGERMHVNVYVGDNGTLERELEILSHPAARIHRPRTIDSVKEEVERILEHAQAWKRVSLWTIIAITIAGFAMLIIAGFVAYLWCRIRLGQAGGNKRAAIEETVEQIVAAQLGIKTANEVRPTTQETRSRKVGVQQDTPPTELK